MSPFFGVNKNGIPYRKKITRKFKAKCIITELAIRKECDLCPEDFWVWPESPDRVCPKCQFKSHFT